jgi:hypothetical protein
MRNFIIMVSLPILLLAFAANITMADVNIGVSADQEGIKEFHLSIGTHYGVKERDIEKVRARSLPDNEMAVVFYLSNRTGVSPIALADLRLSGMSWMEITLRYGLTAEIYYVKYASSPGPPFGKAWGHFNKTPRKEWHKIRLADSDIINLVNLKFLAEKHQCSPDRIIRLIKKGGSYASVHKQFKKEKEAKKQQKAAAKKSADDQTKGKKDKGKK